MANSPIAEALRDCQRLYLEILDFKGKTVTDKNLDGFLGKLDTLQESLYKIVDERAI
jgi:hypothetical protein